MHVQTSYLHHHNVEGHIPSLGLYVGRKLLYMVNKNMQVWILFHLSYVNASAGINSIIVLFHMHVDQFLNIDFYVLVDWTLH